MRPAFSLLTKLLDDFTAKVPASAYANATPAAPPLVSFPEISAYLQKYQDPRQADAIMKVQQELDETKIILVSRPLCSVSFACGRGAGREWPVEAQPRSWSRPTIALSQCSSPGPSVLYERFRNAQEGTSP